MFERAKYIEPKRADWQHVPDHIATKKYDGAHFFVTVGSDGSLQYFSRRPSVQGHYPERTEKLPQLTDKKLPQYAGHVYSVELIHTGHKKSNKESHPAVGGILNSLPPKAIESQKQSGPVRAVLIDVINPALPTYGDKLEHLKEVEKAFGKPDLLFTPKTATTKQGIINLINSTKANNEEGVIITSLTRPEVNNPRIKVKHFGTYNLRVTRIIQEFDINGKPKESMGALECVDKSGRVVCYVGTGFDRATRIDAWKNPKKYLNQLIQVKTMGLGSVGGRLRAPVYNGFADGDIDLVE